MCDSMQVSRRRTTAVSRDIPLESLLLLPLETRYLRPRACDSAPNSRAHLLLLSRRSARKREKKNRWGQTAPMGVEADYASSESLETIVRDPARSRRIPVSAPFTTSSAPRDTKPTDRLALVNPARNSEISRFPLFLRPRSSLSCLPCRPPRDDEPVFLIAFLPARLLASHARRVAPHTHSRTHARERSVDARVWHARSVPTPSS